MIVWLCTLLIIQAGQMCITSSWHPRCCGPLCFFCCFFLLLFFWASKPPPWLLHLPWPRSDWLLVELQHLGVEVLDGFGLSIGHLELGNSRNGDGFAYVVFPPVLLSGVSGSGWGSQAAFLATPYCKDFLPLTSTTVFAWGYLSHLHVYI